MENRRLYKDNKVWEKNHNGISLFMNIKLRSNTEIEMYYEGKKKNMSENDIEISIILLRAICNIEMATNRKIKIIKI